MKRWVLKFNNGTYAAFVKPNYTRNATLRCGFSEDIHGARLFTTKTAAKNCARMNMLYRHYHEPYQVLTVNHLVLEYI